MGVIYNESDHAIACVYFTKKEIIKRGEYKRTPLDDEKDRADFLITSIAGNWYTIFIRNKSINLKCGLSVKKANDFSGAIYYVTENALDRLKSKHTWMNDF